MTVFRTLTLFGGSGFIGRHTIRRLAQTGATIRVPCRYPDKALPLKTAGTVGQIVPYAMDIADDRALKAAVEGADAVINLIGILHETGRNRFEPLQAEFPGRLAATARDAGVKRLIHVSAIGAEKESKSLYARTKAAGEIALRAAFPDAVILRPSVVFGPDDKFFNLFAGMAQWLPALPLIGGGHTQMQPVYVGDVAAAIFAALTRDDVRGKTFELGGPKAYSFRELMEILLKETGMKRALISVPWGVAHLKATLLSLLPRPLLTPDQVRLLQKDNVCAPSSLGLSALGIVPAAIETVLPQQLARFRPGGSLARGSLARGSLANGSWAGGSVATHPSAAKSANLPPEKAA